MIKISPYYERNDRELIEREYLRMIAAATPFYPEDILYDDEEGLKKCGRAPKTRTLQKDGKAVPTAFSKRLKEYGTADGSNPTGQLEAEAELAERIIKKYSKDLHDFLYNGAEPGGHINKKHFRELIVTRLPGGAVPDKLRFDLKRSGPEDEWKRHAKALYEYVFAYDEFSRLRHVDGVHWGTHDFVERLGVKVCPYCNRLFTTTVNTREKRVRPQLDHFRNKNKYPFLALSINNLIPVCGVCNLLKLDKDDDQVYPYEESFAGEEYVFKSDIPAEHTVPALSGVPIDEKDFAIRIEPRKAEGEEKIEGLRDKIKKSIETLSLDELYQSHRDYVSMMYRQRYILTDLLAEDRYRQFPDLFSSVDELKDLFVLMRTDEEHWGDRPLAKLTHDISAEIDELYSREKLRERKNRMTRQKKLIDKWFLGR